VDPCFDLAAYFFRHASSPRAPDQSMAAAMFSLTLVIAASASDLFDPAAGQVQNNDDRRPQFCEHLREGATFMSCTDSEPCACAEHCGLLSLESRGLIKECCGCPATTLAKVSESDGSMEEDKRHYRDEHVHAGGGRRVPEWCRWVQRYAPAIAVNYAGCNPYQGGNCQCRRDCHEFDRDRRSFKHDPLCCACSEA